MPRPEKQHVRSPRLQDPIGLGINECSSLSQSRAHPSREEPGSWCVEIPTVPGEEGSPVSLGALAGVGLISRAGLAKQEDRAL